MPISFAERASFDFYNLITALLGTPTCIPWLLLVLYYHTKFLYIGFTVLWLAYGIYMMYLLFSDASASTTETQITGDRGPSNDFYVMNILILVVYIFIGVMGVLKPEKVGHYRSAAKSYAHKRY
jgi:hypothetical protein